MKLLKYVIIAAAIIGFSGSCFGTATDDRFVSPPWGLAADQQNAEDIPVRDSANGLVGTTVEDILTGLVDGTETFQSLTVTGALTAGSQVTSDTDISATTITLTGNAALDGGITVDNTAFIVDDGTGNITTAGTLAVTGTSAFTGDVAVVDLASSDQTSLTDLTVSDTGSFAGALAADGGFSVDSPAFTVANTSGNVATTGTLAVTGTSTFTGTITADGGVTLGAGDDLIGGTTSDINMNSGNFTVAGATGNTVVGGTLAVTSTTIFTGGVTANDGVTLGDGDDLIGSATSDITMNTNKFTVSGSDGNTLIAGTLAVTGAQTNAGLITANGGVTLGAGDDLIGGTTSDITMNTNKFTVSGSNGNTVVGGTFGVTGNTTLTGTLLANSSITLGAGDDLIGSATSDINMNSLFTVAGASGDITVNTNKFTVAGATGNTLIAGTLTNTGLITANAGLTLGAGDDLIGSATSDITINTTAFTVDGALGDVGVGNDLTVTGTTAADGGFSVDSPAFTVANTSGDLAINTNKFTVTASNGNTLVAGTLTVTGESTFNNHINLGGDDDLIGSATSEIAFNTNQFTVDGSNGNTLIAGTLTQTGVATFAATAIFNGGQTRVERPRVVADDTVPPLTTTLGTTAQSQIGAWGFDANPNATGNDHVYLYWRVPIGYVVDSAKLNFTFSYSTAETDGDDVAFDFTVLAITPGSGAAGGTVWDAAGTGGAELDIDLVNGLGDEGKVMEGQVDIEVTNIAVGDEVLIDFWCVEANSDLNASGTVDVHNFEIEYESTE